MAEAEVKLDLSASDTDEDLFRKITSAFHLPVQTLKTYKKDLLITLISILFQIIRGLIKDTADKEDRIEQLTFQAKKSSKTSSVPPSADGYAGVGANKIDPDELTEEQSEKLQRKDHNRSRRTYSGRKPGHQSARRKKQRISVQRQGCIQRNGSNHAGALYRLPKLQRMSEKQQKKSKTKCRRCQC